MTKTDQYSSGVRGIITRARKYDTEIGNYIEHFINERFSFTVRLSNGRIEMPMEMAHDQETMPSSITEDRIQNIAARFQNNNLKPIIKQQEQTPTEQTIIIKLSLWQRLLKLFGLK
jgi:hypothetical protein